MAEEVMQEEGVALLVTVIDAVREPRWDTEWVLQVEAEREGEREKDRDTEFVTVVEGQLDALGAVEADVVAVPVEVGEKRLLLEAVREGVVVTEEEVDLEDTGEVMSWMVEEATSEGEGTREGVEGTLSEKELVAESLLREGVEVVEKVGEGVMPTDWDTLESVGVSVGVREGEGEEVLKPLVEVPPPDGVRSMEGVVVAVICVDPESVARGRERVSVGEGEGLAVAHEVRDTVREWVKVGEVVEVKDWEGVVEITPLGVESMEALRCWEGETLKELDTDEENDLLEEGEVLDEALGVEVILGLREVVVEKVPLAPFQAVGKGFSVNP